MYNMEVFPARLKSEIRLRGTTYDKIGEAIGSYGSAIYNIANGKHTPRLDTAVRICNVLGVSLDSLLKADPYEGVIK